MLDQRRWLPAANQPPGQQLEDEELVKFQRLFGMKKMWPIPMSIFYTFRVPSHYWEGPIGRPGDVGISCILPYNQPLAWSALVPSADEKLVLWQQSSFLYTSFSNGYNYSYAWKHNKPRPNVDQFCEQYIYNINSNYCLFQIIVFSNIDNLINPWDQVIPNPLLNN